MKIFLTGGGGYIGSSLLYNLSKKYDIICFGHSTNFSKLKKIMPNVEFIEGDIRNEILLNSEMKNCDTVIHLAGLIGNTSCLKDPINAFRSHVIGTKTLLQSASRNHIQKFIFASTASVYTTFTRREMPFFENMRLNPDDFYGTLKAFSESMIQDSNVNYIILRLANVYGYSMESYTQNQNGAISNFIKGALEGSDLTIYGTGKQGIEYININDVCSAIETIINNKKIKNEIFNVGSGKLTKIENLANIIAILSKEILNKKIYIRKVEAPKGSIWPDRLMSIDKIKNLGWKPKTDLEEGIKEIFINLNKGKFS